MTQNAQCDIRFTGTLLSSAHLLLQPDQSVPLPLALILKVCKHIHLLVHVLLLQLQQTRSHV